MADGACDKHGALIELAATWCEAQGRAKLDPMAPIWERRAKMLREGYKPQLVSAPSATAATSEPMGNEPLPPDAEMAVRELAEVDRALKSLLGEWPVYLTHTEQDGSPAKDTLTRAGAMLLCLQKAQPTEIESTGQLDTSPEALLKDAQEDLLRLHGEKMKFFERTIELEREVERYRKGMEAWKATAEEKDRQFVAQRAEERRIGWIPVSERLPEPEIDVLVRGTNGFISIDSVESFEGFDVAVTHWMPLPDGPHGGGKDG